MSDDAHDEPSELPDATPPKKRGRRNPPGTQLKVRGPGRARHFSHARRREMAEYVVQIRSELGMVSAGDVRRSVMEKFDVGSGTAERAMHEAKEEIQNAFWRSAQDAPAMILDGYVEIFRTNMRNGDMREARKTLDSVRDMFGIRGAVNVNLRVGVNLGQQQQQEVTLDMLADFSDEELAIAAKFDALNPGVIDVPDVPSVDDTMDDVASAGENAVAAAADNTESNGGNE